jgi:hypothetical protein
MGAERRRPRSRHHAFPQQDGASAGNVLYLFLGDGGREP